MIREHFEEERRSARVGGRLRIDGTGIALVGLGSAALEVLLDRGQIDDWFGSTFICWMFATGVLCLGTAVFWELRQKDPIIDLRLLANRNFGIACFFLFPVWIWVVWIDHDDSAAAAIAVWVSGD